MEKSLIYSTENYLKGNIENPGRMGFLKKAGLASLSLTCEGLSGCLSLFNIESIIVYSKIHIIGFMLSGISFLTSGKIFKRTVYLNTDS